MSYYERKFSDTMWTNGMCSVFAATLQKRFGGTLWAIADHSITHPDDDILLHAYCVINGIAYDANGPHTLAEASDTSRERWPIWSDDELVTTIWREVNYIWFEAHHDGFDMSYEAVAHTYIDAHKELFPHDELRNP